MDRQTNGWPTLTRLKTEYEIQFPQMFQGGGGACPDVTSMPPMSQCSSAVSNCWSAGEPDWDCPDNGLCCFDGCVNTCLGSSSPPPQQTAPEDDYEDFEDDEAVVISAPAPDLKSQGPDSDKARSPNIGNGLLFPPPDVGYSLPVEDDNGPPSPSSASLPQSSAPSSSSSSSNSPSSSPPASAAASPAQNVPRRPKPSNLPSSQTQVNLSIIMNDYITKAYFRQTLVPIPTSSRTSAVPVQWNVWRK